MVLKYSSDTGVERLRIISEASDKWREIASIICDDPNKISVLELKYRDDPSQCLRQAFIDGFINKKPKRYPQDWNGLIELLDDVGLQTLAEKVKHAISHPHVR